MRFVAFLVATVALVLGCVAAATGAGVLWPGGFRADPWGHAVWGADPWPDGAIGLVAGMAAIGLYLVSRGLTRTAVRRRRMAEAGHATVPFAPEPGESWRPREYWNHFGDPVPTRPPPYWWTLPEPPDGPVPPDEVLRRLWLVRAHLTMHLATSSPYSPASFWHGDSAPRLRILGFTFPFVWGALLIWFGLDTYGESRDSGSFGLSVGAVLALSAVLNAVGLWRDMTAGFRRSRALRAEERRLMALDAARPDGPLGGPKFPGPVRDRLRILSTGVYRPPRDAVPAELAADQELRCTVATEAGLCLLWNPARLADDGPEPLADLVQHVAAGSVVPVTIGVDGEWEVTVRLGSADDAAELTDAEADRVVLSSDPYLYMSDGEVLVSAPGDVGGDPDEDVPGLPVPPGRWLAVVHLIDADAGPLTGDEDGEGPEDLPDFVVLLNPEDDDDVRYRLEVDTFDRSAQPEVQIPVGQAAGGR